MKPDTNIMIVNGDLGPSWHLLFPSGWSDLQHNNPTFLYQQHDNIISYMHIVPRPA